jgi:nitrite reductase/ring-hydroxylating ferredoxin subunit
MSKILVGMIMIVTTLGVIGCGSVSGGAIDPDWITPQVTGTTVSIPVSEVESLKMTHFRMDTSQGTMAFMAYEFENNIYVRANVCPPCGSVGFSLNEGILVCETCATTFDAKTGEGIRGGCVNYPKESVPYQIDSGLIVMSVADLVNAYEQTISPG